MRFLDRTPSALVICFATLALGMPIYRFGFRTAESIPAPAIVPETATGLLANHQLATVIVLTVVILALIAFAMVAGSKGDGNR